MLQNLSAFVKSKKVKDENHMEKNVYFENNKIAGIYLVKGAKIGRPMLTKEDLPEKFYKYYTFYKAGTMTITRP